MRKSIGVVLCLLTLAAIAACGTDKQKDDESASSPDVSLSPLPSRLDPQESEIPPTPASEAGGVCTKLTYEGVERVLHEKFDVAAASDGTGGAQACVLRVYSQNFPILTLSRKPTSFTAEEFSTDGKPEGATDVSGIGEAAYSHTGVSETEKRAEVVVFQGSNIHTLSVQLAPSVDENTFAARARELVTLLREIGVG